MATGSGIPQSNAIVTTDITPSYSVPHDSAIAEAVGNAGDAAQGAVNDLVEKHYQQVGAQQGADVAAGTTPYHGIPVITDVGKARAAAFQSAYLSGVKTQIDAQVDQTQRANQLDPASFKAAADPIVSGYVKNAPGPFAGQVQNYAQTKANAAFQTLSDQKLAHDQVTSVNNLNARQQTLTDQMLGMAAAGQDGTAAYAAAHDEWVTNNASKVANPLFEFGPDMAAAAAEKQDEQLQGAVLTRHAITAYQAAGGGEAGKEAADTMLSDAVADNGALAGMTPDKRQRLFGVALANVRDLDRADAEQRTLDAEKARKDRADRRDAAGTLALGLTDGSVSEADVKSAEANGDIEPGAAARLILSSRAQARQAAAADRAADAADRTAAYGALDEMASNGQLTPAQLKAQGASLTPVQRVALSGKLNKAAKPGIDNITGLAGSSFRDNGVQGAAAKLALENLHADAATFMLANPGATVGQQAAFASDWVKKTKGLALDPALKPPGSGHVTDAQVNASFLAKFHGQAPSQAEVASNLAAFRKTHPK